MPVLDSVTAWYYTSKVISWNICNIIFQKPLANKTSAFSMLLVNSIELKDSLISTSSSCLIHFFDYKTKTTNNLNITALLSSIY